MLKPGGAVGQGEVAPSLWRGLFHAPAPAVRGAVCRTVSNYNRSMINYVKLPIWTVIPRAQHSSTAVEPCDEPAHALAFTEVGLMSAFFQERRAGDWNLRLIPSNEDLLLLIADLHDRNIKALCLNPLPDGSAGTAVALEDLMRQIDP